MPIGPITPGSPVTVTPDVVLAQYSSVQAPTATMVVVGADLQALTLVVLNVQNFCLQESATGLARKLDKIDGGTVSGDVDFTGDFQVNSGQVHVAAGAIQVGASLDVITITGDRVELGNTDVIAGALSSLSHGGTIVLTSTSDTSVDGGGVFRTSNGGKFRWDTRNKSPGSDYTADGTNGYEDILTDPPTNRAITLANTGAAIGQRKKFNAQNVTSFYWSIAYGAKTWFMKNAAGSTVKIEFVYNGSGWVVDDWEEGGVPTRDG